MEIHLGNIQKPAAGVKRHTDNSDYQTAVCMVGSAQNVKSAFILLIFFCVIWPEEEKEDGRDRAYSHALSVSVPVSLRSAMTKCLSSQEEDFILLQ